MEHTHLVKGLDLALLAKVRNELSKEQQRKPKVEDCSGPEASKTKTTLQIHDPRLRRAFHLLFDSLHPHAARFRDRLAHMEMRIMTVTLFIYIYIRTTYAVCSSVASQPLNPKPSISSCS